MASLRAFEHAGVPQTCLIAQKLFLQGWPHAGMLTSLVRLLPYIVHFNAAPSTFR